MAEEETLGIVQLVVILVVTVLFGGILIAVVFFLGRKERYTADNDKSSSNIKVEELKPPKEQYNKVDISKKTSSKNSKRTNAVVDHPKQLCVLKGHTSDVHHIEFSSNGKHLGSTSSGTHKWQFNTNWRKQ